MRSAWCMLSELPNLLYSCDHLNPIAISASAGVLNNSYANASEYTACEFDSA